MQEKLRAGNDGYQQCFIHKGYYGRKLYTTNESSQHHLHGDDERIGVFFPNPCSILGTVQTLWSPYFCGVFGMLRVLDRWTEFVQTRLHADTQLSCSFSFLFSSLGDACAFGTSCSLVGTQASAHGVLSWTPSSTRSLESVDLTPILGAGAPRNHL